MKIIVTREEILDALNLAQDALHMASLPFPVDEVKTQRALEAVNKLLEALEHGVDHMSFLQREKAITALRERLAQPEHEPVCDKDPQGCWFVRCQLGKKCKHTQLQRKPEHHELQAKGEHPAPCARHCEATAFQIVIKNLKAQLAQPEQEPVFDCPRCGHCCPQRKPLTDEEIDKIAEQLDETTIGWSTYEFAQAIEAAHGIKGEA